MVSIVVSVVAKPITASPLSISSTILVAVSIVAYCHPGQRIPRFHSLRPVHTGPGFNVVSRSHTLSKTGEGPVCLASAASARGMSGMFGLRNTLRNKYVY